MGKQQSYSLEGLSGQVGSSNVQDNSSQAPSQSSSYSLEGLSSLQPKKKDDTASFGRASSTAGLSNRNQGADTGNLFSKFFHGLNIGTDQFYGGTYDVVGNVLNASAAALDVIHPINWGADAKIILDAVGAEFKSTGRKISDYLALDSEELQKQKGMDFAQKQKYLKERYAKETSNEDYGFVTNIGNTSKSLYELGGFLQGVGSEVSVQAKLDSGVAKEDLDKGVTDLIGEGKYSDAAAVAALGAVRTIPMSMSLAATGGSTGSIFAGSAFMGAGAEIGEAYKGDKQLSGDELMKAGWYGFIEGLTESVFQTDIKALRSTGKTLISGSAITEAVADAGADEVKRKLVRGFLPTAKKIFYGAGEEGVEEIMSTVGQFIVDKAQSNNQTVTADELWGLAKKAADSFIVGSLSGGGMSGALVMATSNKLDETQKKSIKRLQEVADNQSLSQDTRDIAKNKIDDIMKYVERGAFDEYMQLASIEDVEKRAKAIEALNSIEQFQSDKKAAKDESIQADIDEKIKEKADVVNGLLMEQWAKEEERQPEALKIKLQEAKVKADEYLAENNSYLAFQANHAGTMTAVENNKNVEVEELNKATDQLNEIQQDVYNSQELTPLEKDAILTKIDKQINELETYSNATINGASLSETETEGRRTTTKTRAFERARRVRNNRFDGQIFTVFDDSGNAIPATAKVNERGQITLFPKPKYRVNLETKAAEEVDNSIKIKGDLEVIDKEVNEDGDITKVKVKDSKTGKIFETNSPVLIPLLTANKNIREGVFEPDRAYQVDENIEHIGASPIVNKLTKEQRARIKRYHMALKEINPDSRIVIFDNATEVAKELMKRGVSRKEAILKARTSNGMVIGNDIFIDRMSMNDTTIPHEIFHQAFREIAKRDPKLFMQMQSRIMMVLPNDVAARLQKFVDEYANKAGESTPEELIEMAEEFLVELGGLMTVGEAKIQRGWMHNVMTAIREVLEKYARKFKLNGLADLINSKLFSETAEIEELAQFFESLSKSIRQGTKADLSYVANLTKEETEEDLDNLNSDFNGELYEPSNLNITGTITEPAPVSDRKPNIKTQKRGDIKLVLHEIFDKAGLVGKKYSVTMSDHTKVGEYFNEKSGVRVNNLMGGIFYPYIEGIRNAGIAWASVTSKAAREMIINAENQDYTLVYRMARKTGSRGNVNFNQVAISELLNPVINGKVSEKEFLKQLNEKLNSVSGGTQLVAGESFLSKYGVNSGKKIIVHKTEQIKVEDKKGKLVNKTVKVLDKNGQPISIKVPRLEIQSIDELQNGLGKESFSKRGGFWSTILKDTYSKKSTGEWYKFLEKHQVTSLEDIVNGLAEPETDSANDHDIVSVLKLDAPEYTEKGIVKIYTTRKSLVDEAKGIFFIDAPDHPSYPYVAKGAPVGILNEFNQVTDYFPIIKQWIAEERLNSPYKAVETMGKELVSSREEVKAQKKSTTVYHGGTVQGAKSFNKNNIFFVATDKDEALAYARGNEGNLIQMDIDGSKIASEDEIRQILTDLGVPDEYMIHELIDPRFEDTYIGKKLTSQLISEIEKRGYEGGAFSDTGIAKNRDAQNMFIVNPSKTLSNSQYVGIQLANENDAAKLYKSGYRPLVNGKVIENATEQEIDDLFSKTSNLVSENKLQMVKPSEFEKYNQAGEGNVDISAEIEEFATDGSNSQFEIKSQKKLYHGSPWNFKNFSNEAIGKGEGRQVYGAGMYFSTDYDVAKSYAMSNQGNKLRQLGLLNKLPKNLQTEAYNLLQRQTTTLGDWKSWLNKNKGFWGININAVNRKRLFEAFGERNMYYVSVEDKVNRLQDGLWLDWNQPIGMSNAYQIINGMKETMNTLRGKFKPLADSKNFNDLTITTDSFNIAEALSLTRSSEVANMTGMQFYNMVTSMYRSSISTKVNKFDPQQMASMLLSSAGVDGNRVDTWARTGGRGDNHKNYIVFDANAITVLNKETIKAQKKQPTKSSQVLDSNIESQERRQGDKKIMKNLMQGKFNEAFSGVSQVGFELYRSAYKASFDRMVNVRKEMEDSEFNRSMYLMFNKAGASQFGNFKFEKAFAKIYKGLTEEQIKALDSTIFLRRVVAIDENFDKQRLEIENKLVSIGQIIEEDPSLAESYADEITKLKKDLKKKARPKHPTHDWGDKKAIKTNRESAQVTLKRMEEELGEEAYADMISRSDAYFQEFSNILKYKMQNGIITQETYNMFKDYNYSPRKFLDYAFGIEERDANGNLTGRILFNENQFFFRGALLSSKDIKNIEGGSEDFMVTDSRKLLQGAMIMAEVKVATNKMIKALATDSQLTNQGWVKPMEYERYNDKTIKTNPDGSYKYLDADKGFRKMIYKEDGKEYAYQLREDLAKEILDEELTNLKGEEGSLRRKVYDITTKMSGSRAVKFFATGINTGFFISNIPVDVISQVNVTDIYAGGVAGQYKQAIGGTLDLAKRLTKIEMGFEDPYVEKLLQEYAESGGLMMTQTEQGLGLNVGNKLVQYLALFGNISEVASKLNSYRSVRERLMDEYYDKNKMNPVGDDLVAIKEEAAYKARAAMDYHRGGLISKMWDGYVPYFNVFTQGAFISWKYIKNNPTVFFDKVGKAGIALAGLTVYNMMVAGADYDNDDVQMDLLNKIVIFMPWRNPDGTRSYWKISVPPIVKGFLNTFQHIGEGSYYKYVSQEPSRQQKWREGVMEKWLDGFRPSLATMVGVPVAKAALEYHFGEDLYRNVPIFAEGKYPISTSNEGINEEKVLEAFKMLGKVFGISPIKGQKAFEDIVPAYNPAVQLGYAAMDKAIDSMNPLLPDGTRLKETQRSKYGKGDLTNVPFSFLNGIKDRLIDKSDPTVVYMKNKDKSIMSDEKRGDVYYDLKAEIKLLDKNNGTTDDLIAKIRDKAPIEQKFAINYFFMLQKRDMLNYPEKMNEYSDVMFSSDSKSKAEKLYTIWGNTNLLNPQNEQEQKYANDLIMLKVLDAPTMMEYQNYFKPTGVQTSENQ